jgi:hypothetical protein
MISGSRTFRIGHWEFFSHSDLGISDFRLHSPRYFNQAANALAAERFYIRMPIGCGGKPAGKQKPHDHRAFKLRRPPSPALAGYGAASAR